MKIFHKIMLAASISSLLPLLLMCLLLIQFERKYTDTNLLQIAALPLEYIISPANIKNPVIDFEFSKQTGEIISSNVIEINNVFSSLLIKKEEISAFENGHLLIKSYQNGETYKGVCENSFSEKTMRCRLVNLLLLRKDVSAFIDMLITIILFAAIIVLIAVYIVSRVLSKPIEMVSDYLNTLPEQDFKYELEMSSSDELGVLTKRLKSYADRLLYYKDETIKQKTLAAIGQSTAMLAHDVRKPFSIVKSLIESYDTYINDPKALKEAKISVDKSIKHVESMINDIMDFSREVKLEVKPTFIIPVLDFSIRQVAQSYGDADISFNYKIAHVHQPLVDDERIARVFANILSNAVEAILHIGKSEYGLIDISTQDLNRSGKSTVAIVIGNDGPPLNDDDIPK